MSATDATEDTECPTCGRDDFASKTGVKCHHAQVHGESLAKTTLACDRCGEEYKVYEKRAEESHFCSKECRKNQTTLTCEGCGEQYDVQEHRADESRFCSKECRENQTTLECEQCGSSFEVPACRSDTARFCSVDCKGQWYSNQSNEAASKEPINIECEQCGDTFQVRPHRADTAKYCSDRCKHTHSRKTFTCKECGRQFNPSDNRAKYCSMACYARSQRDRVTIECKQCGSNFEVPDCRSDSARFCSTGCLDKWKEGRPNEAVSKEAVDIECEQCGDTFQVRPHRADTAKYCSGECKYQAMSQQFSGAGNPSFKSGHVTLECDNCSSEFEVIPSRSDEARFCSEQCNGEWISENMAGEDHPLYEGGYRIYEAADYQKNRERALERDGYECQMCGMTNEEHISEYGQGLHTHHIRPVLDHEKHENPHTLENLIVLCGSCHRLAEQMAPLRPDTTTAGD